MPNVIYKLKGTIYGLSWTKRLSLHWVDNSWIVLDKAWILALSRKVQEMRVEVGIDYLLIHASDYCNVVISFQQSK